MKSFLFVILMAACFSPNAFSKSCLSESGARVDVEGGEVLRISNGDVSVKSTEGRAILFQGYSEVLLNLNCEYGTKVSFKKASSQVIVVCNHHTGFEVFSALLNCQN